MKMRISILFLLLCSSILTAQDARSFYQKGRERFEQQDYYGAIESFQEALEQNPHYLDALLELSRSYFQIEEYQEAQRFIEEAQKYGQNDLNLMNMEARILVGKNELDLAEERFRQVIQREPNNLDANLGLAEVLLLRGHTQEGAVAFRRSLILSPESKRALLSTMLLYDFRGEYELGEIYLDLALQHHGGDPQVYLQAAFHYLKAGNLEKALFYGENAVQMNPDLAGPDYLLATIYYERAEYEKASAALQRELKRDPQNLQSMFLLARTLEKQDQNSQALILYERILREDPLDEITRLHWEDLIRSMGEDAQSLRTRAADYHYQRGLSREEEFDFPGSLLEYRRSRWLDPYHYLSWEAYSRILAGQGYPEKSLDTLRAMKAAGYDDSRFQEQLMMLEHSHQASLSDRWDINQFNLAPNDYEISLFYYKNTKMHHYTAEREMAEFFRYHMMKTEYLDFSREAEEVSGFSQAYSQARTDGSDYFLVLEISEQERSFLMKVTLYLTRTGREIRHFSLLRMGNNRVQSAVAELSDMVASFFIPRGYLIRLKGEQGLLNLGRLHGVEEGDVYQVFRRNSLVLLSEEPWLEYNDADLLGFLTIEQVDEAISLGKWENYGPFTRVAENDEAFLLTETQPVEEEPQWSSQNWTIDENLKGQLLMLQ